MDEVIEVSHDIHADRIMRSTSARNNRKVIKTITLKKNRKIETENEKLLQKHETLLKNKKNKKEK